jgi:hypothetical protein
VTLEEIASVLDNGFGALKHDAPEYDQRLTELLVGARDPLNSAAYAGMYNRLRAISEGKFGPVLAKRPTLDWDTASSEPSVTYIGLSATAASEDVALFARLLIQDLKQLCARRLRAIGKTPVQPLLLIFDEFAALGDAPQIRDLLLQSRQALMPTIVCQQYIPFDEEIRASVLQSGILLCHRLIADDAQTIANELGTRRAPLLTNQLDFTTGQSEKGSIRQVEEYRVHPNTLRGLQIGQAVVMSRRSDRRAIVRIKRDEL